MRAPNKSSRVITRNNTCLLLSFLTDPNRGGVEKITISGMRAEFGMRPLYLMDPGLISPDAEGLLPPQQLVFVKGWSRSVAALTVSVRLRAAGVFRGFAASESLLNSTLCRS